jgi:Ca-activated chloride channel family protein
LIKEHNGLLMGNFVDLFYRVMPLEGLRFFFQLPAVLFLAIPVIVWVYLVFQKKRRWRVKYPVTSALARMQAVKRIRRPSRHLPVLIRILALSLVILAAMRPQMGTTRETVNTQGVDIMLTLDISPSMLAQDFAPSRVEAAKDVLTRFVRQNQNDRIGLVVFSGMAFTQCPMTTDTAILEEFISQVQIGDVLQDGTAIGDAIITALARFPDQNVPSKIMILTTDGENNLGTYEPDFAARVANRLGVRIYTIGVGSPEGTPIPDPTRPGEYLHNYFGQLVYTRLDEAALRDIAQLTGGRYYRAADEHALAAIYDEIGQLETHEIESHRYTVYSELYQYVLGAAVLLLIAELLSRLAWGRVLP